MEKNQLQVVKPDKILFIQKLKLKRKIAVPDIKQYLADEFKLVNEQEKFIKEQGKKIRNFEVMQQKYDLTLITLNEYKERIEKLRKEKDKLLETIEKQKRNKGIVLKNFEKTLYKQKLLWYNVKRKCLTIIK